MSFWWLFCPRSLFQYTVKEIAKGSEMKSFQSSATKAREKARKMSVVEQQALKALASV